MSVIGDVLNVVQNVIQITNEILLAIKNFKQRGVIPSALLNAWHCFMLTCCRFLSQG